MANIIGIDASLVLHSPNSGLCSTGDCGYQATHSYTDNDGVVLNIAPLHELVPWKEAQKYWDQLINGEYEWSSIGKQLREKGLVE